MAAQNTDVPQTKPPNAKRLILSTNVKKWTRPGFLPNVHNPRSAVVRKDEYRRTLVKRGATIGANATIVCGVTLGEYCFIGVGAVITRDVKPYALMAGVPARQIGWMSRHGERLDLPLTGNTTATSPATGEIYRLEQGIVSVQD
ncbi:UDP-2-acetamido-3-amino-2,3-dideoxy-D-glucuronate N-acetyltransferase [Thiorhodovibrio winogradskyi]|uniref:UDP-2-acetamido-3-amino-2, 3-dideoxy-D-glucuronate N-acetyltransferase n=1 Tax=Thiorhodovibrio winogradskyi TaxID=77007 RepID=A0ABZ0SDW4_9GAMM